jgi:pimeloyl-ACP methyl ester carboxylesterase
MKQIDRLIEIKSGHPVAWFSVNRVVAQLSIPILWIHDASDEITPLADTAPTRERKSTQVQFRITEGLGHRRVYRDQSVCQEILDFLTPGR